MIVYHGSCLEVTSPDTIHSHKTVELFLDGLIDKTEAISRLRYEKPNLQICFRTQSVIDRYLKFEGSECP